MKKILLSLFVALLSLSVMAQGEVEQKSKSTVRYQGEALLGLGIGVTYPMPLVEIHTIHGIAVGDYFSTGIGIGLDLPSIAVPVYLNLRGYLPVSAKTRLFLNLDVGASVITPAFYIAPAFGANFKVSRKSSINVSATYKSYIVDKNTSLPGGVVIRVGFQF